jgi:predicted homoserine dehydrogenase-like protein
MNLFSMLGKRAEDGNPVRIGMIGAGKFGTMFLSQVRKLPGIHLIGIADLSPANARSNLEYVGWQPEQFGAASLDEAVRSRRHPCQR